MISIEFQSTIRTIMDTHFNSFGDNRMTFGAFLRRAAWANECKTPTSVCSFVGGELHKFTPSDIGNATSVALVIRGLHILDVEIFKGNELVLIHQLARCLMSKVIASIGRPFVGVTKRLDNLTPLCTTL